MNVLRTVGREMWWIQAEESEHLGFKAFCLFFFFLNQLYDLGQVTSLGPTFIVGYNQNNNAYNRLS